MPETEENLAIHEFMLALTAKYPSTYANLFANEWILCVPKKRSVFHDGSVMTFDSITEDLLLTHILRQLPVANSDSGMSLKGRTQGILDGSSRITIKDFDIASYQSLNGKLVNVHDRTIQTVEGFNASRTVDILYDEIVYDEKGQSFPIVCISAPLEGPFQESAIQAQNVEKEYLWHWFTDSIFTANLSLKRFLETYIPLKASTALLTSISQLVLKYCDKIHTISNLTILERETKDVIERSFKIIPSLMRTLSKPVIDVPQIQLLITEHVLSNLYDFNFFRVCSSMKDQEQLLQSSIMKLRYLDLCQLGVPNSFGRNLKDAISIFQELPVNILPSSKLDCMLKAFKALGKPCVGESGDLHVGTDQLVPLLMLMVIRSDIPHITANIYYTQHFCFNQDVSLGEAGYVLSSFEAVLSYLSMAREDLAEASSRNKSLWDSICHGNIDQFAQDILNSYKDGAISTGTPSSPIGTNNILCRNNDGQDCAMIAISCGNVEILKYILTNEICLFSSRDYSLNSILHTAVESKSTIIVKLLITDFPVNLNYIKDCRNDNGMTAIHLAVKSKLPEIFDALIDFGCDIDQVNHDNSSAIQEVISDDFWNFDLVSKAIVHSNFFLGADKNDNGVLHSIINDEICSLVLKRIPVSSFTWQNKDGENPILFSAKMGRMSIFKQYFTFALTRDQKVLHDTDAKGQTLLHIICLYGHEEILVFLHQNATSLLKTLLSRKNYRGETPLHLAARTNHIAIVELLLKYGADTYIRNHKGFKPSDVAAADCQSLLDNFALSTSYALFNRSRIAILAKAEVDKSQNISLIIRSFKCAPDTNSQNSIVRRSLQDIFWLRKQIINQYPEAILSIIDGDLSTSPFKGFRPLSFVLNKLVRRIDTFLQELLDHPKIGWDSTLMEFLDNPVLDKIKILDQQDRFKRSESRILPVEANVFNLEESDYVEKMKTKLSASIISYPKVLKQAKLSFKARNAMITPLKELQDVFRRADSFLPSNSLLILSSTLSKTTEAIYYNTSNELALFSELSTICTPYIQGAVSSLKGYDTKMQEYQSALNQKQKTQDIIDKLESQIAKSENVQDDLVMKLSELYYNIKKVSETLEQKTNNLYGTCRRIRRELEHFFLRMAHIINAHLGLYCGDVLEREKALLQELRTLEDTFVGH